MQATEDRAILAGDPPVTVTIRRSARSRRMSLRVSGLDGRVTLSLPPRMRLAEGLAFLREREGWIRGALLRQPEQQRVAPGVLLPVEGAPLLLTEAKVARVVQSGETLLVPPGGARFAPRVEAWLRRLALERLAEACGRHSARLGRPYARIVLRDTRSRWGSCTVDGRLMFSWRLILAPPEVLDYVAAHEVAHLARMDHSPAFWAVVETLLPGHEAQRRWLMAEGRHLHRWQFC